MCLQYIRNPISTLCVGQAASMASLLLAAGEPGHRRSLPNSRIMLHQPSGGFQVQNLANICFLQYVPVGCAVFVQSAIIKTC